MSENHRFDALKGAALEGRAIARPAPHKGRQPGRGPSFLREHTMDIERINAIGTTLADLTERTEALRGYL
ncbi:hypothetical protein [Ideonella sp. YS5]|uniref:hypothetical protein n=1 Tax=Ideonella sp. YS5 TaxID=3453714 RepID=UPI003EEDE5A5